MSFERTNRCLLGDFAMLILNLVKKLDIAVFRLVVADYKEDFI